MYRKISLVIKINLKISNLVKYLKSNEKIYLRLLNERNWLWLREKKYKKAILKGFAWIFFRSILVNLWTLGKKVKLKTTEF